MEPFLEYKYALLSIVLYSIVAQILNAATGIKKGGDDIAPGANHKATYDHAPYRLDRTYMNTIEMMGFYIALVFAAILAGANPFWVNTLASLGLVFRILANLVYIRGIGKAYGGLRTNIIILASVVNLALAGFAIQALI